MTAVGRDEPVNDGSTGSGSIPPTGDHGTSKAAGEYSRPQAVLGDRQLPGSALPRNLIARLMATEWDAPASHKIFQEIATAGFSLGGVNFIEVYLAIDNCTLGTIYDSQPMNVCFDRFVSACQQPKVGMEVL